MTPSSEIINHGIKKIHFKSNSTFTLANIHQNGLYHSDMMPAAIAEYAAVERVTVTHEQINVLDFDGEPCNNEIDYLMDLCIQDKILNVRHIFNAFYHASFKK